MIFSNEREHRGSKESNGYCREFDFKSKEEAKKGTVTAVNFIAGNEEEAKKAMVTAETLIEKSEISLRHYKERKVEENLKTSQIIRSERTRNSQRVKHVTQALAQDKTQLLHVRKKKQ